MNERRRATQTPNPAHCRVQIKDARVHCAVLNVQPATTGSDPTRPTPPHGRPRERGPPQEQEQRYEIPAAPAPRTTSPPPPPHTNPCAAKGGCPFPQDPTACLRPAPTPHRVPHPPQGAVLAAAQQATGRTGQRSTLEHHPGDPRPTRNWADRHTPSAA